MDGCSIKVLYKGMGTLNGEICVRICIKTMEWYRAALNSHTFENINNLYTYIRVRVS